MNKPYVKEYKDGVLSNPIKGSYLHSQPNRAKRRDLLRKKRFVGNGKQTPLLVTPTAKFLKVVQYVLLKDLTTKRIERYQPL